jgi:excisionase family DNA binding protein
VERKDSAASQHTTITVPEISDRLDVCEETVYELLKSGKIPNIRHGRRFIISRAAYEQWEAHIGQTNVLDIHHNADPSCAERRRMKRKLKEIMDSLKPESN